MCMRLHSLSAHVVKDYTNPRLHQLPECSLALSFFISSVCITLRAYSHASVYCILTPPHIIQLITNILQRKFYLFWPRKSSDLVRTWTGLVLDQTSLELGSGSSSTKPKALSSERVQVQGFPARTGPALDCGNFKPDASWRSCTVAREDTTQGEMKEVILLWRTFYPSSGFAFVWVIKNKELKGVAGRRCRT